VIFKAFEYDSPETQRLPPQGVLIGRFSSRKVTVF
jgi:hypothetical protein